jgi:hypothetical protein
VGEGNWEKSLLKVFKALTVMEEYKGREGLRFSAPLVPLVEEIGKYP